MANMYHQNYLGEWMYFNHSDGGVVTGFGTERLFNTGSNLDIYFNTGNGHVDNWGSNVNIYNDYKNNIIVVGPPNSNSNSNYGNNVNIFNIGDNAYIDCMRGKKTKVVNSGKNVLVGFYEGNEDNVCENSGSNVTIHGGDTGKSTITNSGSNVTISCGSGDNTIESKKASNVIIETGDGHDFVSVLGAGQYVTIKGGKDSDCIYNEGGNAVIYGNSGEKSSEGGNLIQNKADYAVIFGSELGDRIDNYGSHVYIQGNNGDSTLLDHDWIYTNKGEYVTIDAGNGDDKISVFHDVGASVIGGGGNDHIVLVRITAADLEKFIGGNLATGLKDIYETTRDSMIVSGLAIAAGFFGSPYLAAIAVGIIIGDAAKGIIELFKDLNNFVKNVSELLTETTVVGGEGDDVIVGDGLAPRVFEYSDGDGNDTIYYFNINKVAEKNFHIKGLRSLSLSTLYIKKGSITGVTIDDNDLIFEVGEGSIKLVYGANHKFKLREADGTVTTRSYSKDSKTGDINYIIFGSASSKGVEFSIKKPTTITIEDSFSGIVDATDFSDKVTTIDASKAVNPVELRAGDKASVIKAGSGGATLVGGAGADKLYGGSGVDYFTYTVGQGADALYSVSSSDIVSIDGADRNNLTLKDSKNVVTVGFTNDAKSKLTVNKNGSADAITFNLGGTTYTYGARPTGVTFDNDDKKTAINIDSTAADGVTVNAAEIVSTAKTIDGSDANGSVYLIGNDNANIIKAGYHGSTLFGGRSTKAVADKLYGGSGSDVFMWSTLDGADVIYGFDGSQGDYVSLGGVTEIKANDVKVSANKVEVTLNKQKLTLDNPNGEIKFVGENGTELYSTGFNFPTGVGYNAKKTAITVGSAASNVGTIDLSSPKYLSTVKDIDASEYNGAINIVGNANANVLKASKGASTLNGGAGADKLYGGDGADVFVYADGGGADVIYNFDGKKDRVVLDGVKSLASSAVKASATKVDVTIGKGKLTFDNPNGEIKFVNENGAELYSMGVNFPTGVGYNPKKTAVTIGSAASNVGTIDLSSPKYLSTVKEVNASEYDGAIKIVGNGQANVLTAGKGGSTLNGGYALDNKGDPKATADKLYGGSDADIFIWDASTGGGDQIFNYDQSQGDIISITGSAAVNKNSFKDGGKTVTLTVGKQKLTVNDVKDKPIVVVNGDDTITYGSLPGGVSYNDKKTVLTIGAPFVGTIDAADYVTSVATIDASSNTGEIILVGGSKTKAIVGGAGQTTLRGNSSKDIYVGGTGADTFVYSVGGGKDQIVDFDSDTDVIRLFGATVTATDFTENKNDVVLKIGSGSITIKDAPRGTIDVKFDGGSMSYKTMPTGVIYDPKKNIVKLDKTFGGTLNAADLGVTVKEINGSAATAAVELRADSDATKITASKSGSTMIGGKGNDTLIGGNGRDVFVSSGGNDLIDKYTAGSDKISIVGSLTAGKANGSNVELTTSDGTMAIKGAVGKELTVVVDGTDRKYKFAKTTTNLTDAFR